MVASGRKLRAGRVARGLFVVSAAVGLAVLAALPGVAEPSPEPNVGAEFVKYYVVTESYMGAPENLYEIANRFLGSRTRHAEIMDLNAGRRQPDGGKLSDPLKLTPGWSLVLPWDAIGREVKMGVVPTTMPKPPTPSGAAEQPPSGPAPSASRAPRSSPKATPSATRGDAEKCVVTGGSSGKPSDWASRRLGIADSWSHTKGDGVMVAVVDSGVDASLPQLSGRVADGADIVTGRGRGGTDCVGTGTAMASLIAAQPVDGSTFTGVAPESTIVPIRLAATAEPARPADQAAAIDVAVSTGATVIALGSFVSPDEPEVARAISDAVSHDVVVVVGALERSAAGGHASPTGPVTPGVLRVGGIGSDGKPAARYRPGGVDVVAPGVNVAYLGVAGTGTLAGSGTQYAVALVAGQAALVRAAHPDLPAAAVAHRIKATADPPSGTVPDQTFGWGVIDPAVSVTRELPGEKSAVSDAPTDSGGSHLLLLAVVAVVALGAIALVTLRLRRILRAERQDTGDEFDEFETRPLPQLPPDVGESVPASGRG